MTQNSDTIADTIIEEDTVKMAAEAKRQQHRTSLIPLDFDSFNLWTASYDFAYPFKKQRDSDTPEEAERNRQEVERWFDDAFRELLEVEELSKVYHKLNTININAGNLFQIELQGKFRYLTGPEVAERRRKLRAVLWFLANYSGNQGWHITMKKFDAGEVTLEDIKDDDE